MGINISHVDHEMFRHDCIVAEVNRAFTKQTNIVAKEISCKFLEISILSLAYTLHGTRYTLYCIYTDLKCRGTLLMDYMVQTAAYR